MPQRAIKCLVVMVMVLGVTGLCHAAMVPFATFELEVDSNGTFEIYVEVSPNTGGKGNKGLAAYSLPLAGDIISTGTSNQSPAGNVRALSLGANKDIGFTSFRTMMERAGDTYVFSALQTFDQSSPFIVFGFGQESGNLADHIFDPRNQLDTFGLEPAGSDGNYDARLLLVTGNWDASGMMPHWNKGDLINAKANLYEPNATRDKPSTLAATIVRFDSQNDNIMTITAVPEPASLVLFGLGSVMLLPRRRRKV